MDWLAAGVITAAAHRGDVEVVDANLDVKVSPKPVVSGHSAAT